MATYKIKIIETLSRVIEVEADDYYEALDQVENDYQKGDIVLDYEDFDEVEFFKIN